VARNGYIRAMEKFIQIKDHNYFVGDKGSIKGLKKLLSPKTKSNGYKEVQIYINKKPLMKYVHRLVAEYWIGEIPKGYNINHIDGNKANNTLENLEIVTPSQNRLHSYYVLNNKIKPMKGEEHPRTNLTNLDVKKIRFMYDNEKINPIIIHKKYENKISLSCIRKICYKNTWKHI